MQRGKLSRIIPIVLVVLVLIIAVTALVSLGQAIFSGGDSTEEVDTGRQALLDTSVSSSVQMTVRGPIVANENFRSYQITISPNDRNMTTYRGYLRDIVDSQALSNNTRAYDEFVHALDIAGLMNGEELPDEEDDISGICANGNVYEFAVLDNNNQVKRLWTTTCGDMPGSFDANFDQIASLFAEQIPGSDDLLDEIRL